MNTPEDMTVTQDALADLVVARKHSKSEVERMADAGRTYQREMVATIDRRRRSQRVKVLVALVSLALVIAGAWVSCHGVPT